MLAGATPGKPALRFKPLKTKKGSSIDGWKRTTIRAIDRKMFPLPVQRSRPENAVWEEVARTFQLSYAIDPKHRA